jgi:peptidoglycan hydrolase CwlO-like protein
MKRRIRLSIFAGIMGVVLILTIMTSSALASTQEQSDSSFLGNIDPVWAGVIALFTAVTTYIRKQQKDMADYQSRLDAQALDRQNRLDSRFDNYTNELKDRLDSIEEENRDMVKKIAELEGQISVLKTQRDDKTLEIATLRNQVYKLQEENYSLRKE